MKPLQKILRTSLQTRLTLIDQMIVSGCNFLLGIILTRALGLTQYGAFALAWMGILLASSLQQGILIKPMMSLSQEESDQERYFLSCLLLQIGFSISCGLISLVVLAFPGLFDGQQVFALSLPILIAFHNIQEFWRKLAIIRRETHITLLLDSVAYGGSIITLLFFFLTDQLSLSISMWTLVMYFAVSSLLGFLLVKIKSKRPKPVEATLKKHWKFGSWLIYTSFLQFFSGNYFLIVAAALLGTAAVGALRIGQNLIGLTHVLFLTMENTIPLRAATAFQESGLGGMRDYLKLVSIKTSGLLIAILAGIAICAPWLISIFYGQEYVEYTYLLWAYAVLYVFIFPGYILRFALRTISYTQPIFIAYVGSSLFGFLAAYPIINAWGMMGVIYGLVISQIIMHTCYGWLFFRRIKRLNC